MDTGTLCSVLCRCCFLLIEGSWQACICSLCHILVTLGVIQGYCGAPCTVEKGQSGLV